ncbi:hypothetical protein V6Z11_A05G079000 [Gossypium hirsutum]
MNMLIHKLTKYPDASFPFPGALMPRGAKEEKMSSWLSSNEAAIGLGESNCSSFVNNTDNSLGTMQANRQTRRPRCVCIQIQTLNRGLQSLLQRVYKNFYNLSSYLWANSPTVPKFSQSLSFSLSWKKNQAQSTLIPMVPATNHHGMYSALVSCLKGRLRRLAQNRQQCN